MKKRLKQNQHALVLAVIGIVCFFIYSFLGFFAPKEIFNSPDETANYVFGCGYAHNKIAIAEPDNPSVQGIIHPRSATSNFKGDIVPGYFLGMPIILGSLGDVFSCGIIPFIVPLVSAITPVFFYFGLKKIFEKDIALISSLLLYFHPVYIYYNAKSLMPNVLFVDLIIISLSLVLCARTGKGIKKIFSAQPIFFYFLSGFFLGLALCIRPSEIFWVFFVYLVLFLFRIHKVNWFGLFFGAVAVGIAVLPTFILNNELYGGYFKLGYNTRLFGVDLAQEDPAGFLKSIFSFSMIFPFGLKVLASVNAFINYFWRLLGWFNVFLIPGILGFIAYLFSNKKMFARKTVYALVLLAVSAYLILYYGSYIFHDHVDASKITLGTSYLRYWLPIFVLALPIMAYSIYAIWRFFEKRGIKIKALSAVLFFFIIGYFTFNLVFIETDESLFAIKKNLEHYSEIRQKVVEQTEENAIIITDRSDKIFFPERKVIVFLENYAIFPLVSKIVEIRPTYYYSMYSPDDINYLAEKKMENARIEFVLKDKFDRFYLYKMIRKP